MGPPAGVLALLRRARLLQVIVVVVLIANLTIGGTFEVALPALAHAHYGAPGYGALLAAFAVGQVVGTLAAARARGLRRPAAAACGVLLAGGLAMGLLPFLGGLVGAVGAIVIFGACNGFGNTLFITLLQQWAPVRLLGRVMSLVMLAAMGSFPVSVAVSGLLVHRLGPAPFFPAAAALLIVTIVGALTQRELRSFGVRRTQAAVSAR
jgi:MFS family permease